MNQWLGQYSVSNQFHIANIYWMFASVLNVIIQWNWFFMRNEDNTQVRKTTTGVNEMKWDEWMNRWSIDAPIALACLFAVIKLWMLAILTIWPPFHFWLARNKKKIVSLTSNVVKSTANGMFDRHRTQQQQQHKSHQLAIPSVHLSSLMFVSIINFTFAILLYSLLTSARLIAFERLYRLTS